ncbi:MAG TPA: CDP-alcohol phosphatidyltransferase family protein [Patescibacteria group bacterium]|nr:CDP-alcohol phosphatidyltransferase family protein [Patescibacteria group bacterium]
MKLHHASTKPDWEQITSAKHTTWQHIAYATRGIITPGNILSCTGLVFTLIGVIVIAKDKPWGGLALVAVGRLFDILDGMVAERTHTKSPLGEGVDATFDKIAAFACLLVFSVTGILPEVLAWVIGIQNAITVVLSLFAKSKHWPIHPVAAGKIGVAVEWVALLFFVLFNAVWYGQLTAIIAYSLTFAAIALNAIATGSYVRTMLAQGKAPRSRR